MSRLALAAAVVATVVSACGTDYGAAGEELAGPPGPDAGPAPSGDAGPGAPPPVVGPVVDDVFTDGARLKATFLELGGVRQFVDWFDTELDVHCTFRPSATGYHCEPVAPRREMEDVYTANDCTGRLVSIGACAVKPVMVDTGSACAPKYVRAGAELPSPTWYRSGSACYKNDAADVFYAPGDTVAATQLVAGALDPPVFSDGAAVGVQTMRGADGSVGFHALVTRRLAAACRFQEEGGELRCIPAQLATFQGFAESTCITPIFTGGCETPGLPIVGRIVAPSSDPCSAPAGTPGAYWEVGAVYSGANYRSRSGVCAEGGIVFGQMRLGLRPVATEELGTAARHVERLTDRLDVVYARLPTGERTKIGFFDRTMNADCTLQLATDGAWRCLPSRVGAMRLLYDGTTTCSTTAPRAYAAAPGVEACRFSSGTCPGACPVTEPPAFVSSFTVPPSCVATPPKTSIYRVGAKTPTSFRPTAIGACAPLDRADEAAHEATEIAPAEFAPATVISP